MAPKKAVGNDKALEKQKAKIADDKTFGLKNKNKSKVVQKYVKMVTSQVKGGPSSSKDIDKANAEKKAKASLQQQQALLAGLFGGSKAEKEAEEKRKKAKEEKMRLEKEEAAARAKAAEPELFAKLRPCLRRLFREYKMGIVISAIKPLVKKVDDGLGFEIVESQFGYENLEKMFKGIELKEDIKIETRSNGVIVIRPPTWVKPDDSDDEDDIPVEEQIEMERAALPSEGLTPMTAENFFAWKKMKQEQRAEAARATAAKQKGKLTGISGRDLFAMDQSLFVDDDDAVDEDAYEEDENNPLDDEEDVGAIDKAVFMEEEELPDDLDD